MAKIPIIVLSARGGEINKVKCLEIFVNHLVSLQGESINLTATEYRMLAYLALNAGR